MSKCRATTQDVPNVFAIVLAGGRGSRLYDLTSFQAKPALPFGGFTRLIDFPLSNCYNSGIRQIAVASQYCSSDLTSHVQSAWNFLSRRHDEFVDLWPAHQREGDGSWYAGTADAVCKNLDLLAKHAPDYVLILAGDHVYKQDYRILVEEHIRNGADITVSCLEVDRADASQFGCVAVDANDRITGFVEKPSAPPVIPGEPGKTFASMGIYVFNYEFLVQALRADQNDPQSRHDFGLNIIPNWYRRRRAYAHRFAASAVTPPGGTAYWRDVGTVDAFWQAHMDLLRPDAPIDLFSHHWPISGEQMHQRPTRFLPDADGREGVATNSIIASGCEIIGARIKDSVVSSDVRIGSGSNLERCVVLPGATIGEHCFYADSIIGPETVIPSYSSLESGKLPASLRVHFSATGKHLITQAALYAMTRIPDSRDSAHKMDRSFKMVAGE